MALVAKLPEELEAELNRIRGLDTDELQRIHNILLNARVQRPWTATVFQIGNEISLIGNLKNYIKNMRFVYHDFDSDWLAEQKLSNGKSLRDYKEYNLILYDILNVIYNIPDTRIFKFNYIMTDNTIDRLLINDNVLYNANIVARKNPDGSVYYVNRHTVASLLKSDIVKTLLEIFIDYYYTFILPAYQKYYLSMPELKYRRPGGVATDLIPYIYKLYISSKNIIKLLAQREIGRNITGLTNLIVPDSEPNIINQPADDPGKIVAIGNYNALTDFYNKHIKPYVSLGAEDNANIMYMRSHFFPAIDELFKSLPERGRWRRAAEKLPWVKEERIGSTGQSIFRPQRGGLRYGQRRPRHSHKIED
jgi:hypothetical protein